MPVEGVTCASCVACMGKALSAVPDVSEKWHDFFPDPTVVDAVLDRVVHQAHRLQLKGESMRKLRAGQRWQRGMNINVVS